jgi:hypothetical protein
MTARPLTGCEQCRTLLSQGLDLCIRARKLDAMDRRAATLSASKNPDEWQESGQFDRYVKRHNIQNPESPIATRSATVPLWAQQQYELDLARWEEKARQHLLQCDPGLMP